MALYTKNTTEKEASEAGSTLYSSLIQAARAGAQAISTVAMAARRSLLAQQEDEEKWYKGVFPTSGEVGARIWRIAQQDQTQAAELFNTFSAFQSDPSTPFYNPYTRATNSAIDEIAKLGVDVSGGINDDWLRVNAGLMNSYRTGATGTPLAPASKSTPQQDAAYQYYRILGAEETTRKAETEWEALQEEIAYWTRRADRNYSDDEILRKIDWNNYKTLTGLDEAKKKGVPVMLNRAIGYSQDALSGVIWAARNGSTGDAFADSTMATLGEGIVWQENPEIAARLDPTSTRYNPYAAGSTMDDEGLYFGVDSFAPDWLTQNQAMRGSRDATEREYYAKVYRAEQTTLEAERELKNLKKYIADQIKMSSDPEEILSNIEFYLGDDYPTLKKMDDSRYSGDLMAMTRAVDYSWEDIEDDVRKMCDAKNSAVKGGMYLRSIAATLGYDVPNLDSMDAVSEAKDKAIGEAARTVMLKGTETERRQWESAYSADYDTYLTQINKSLSEGADLPNGGYDYSLRRANAYAAQNYLPALERGDTAMINRILDSYGIPDRLANLLGVQTSAETDMRNVLDYVAMYGKDYKPTEWRAQSVFDEALSQGAGYEEIAQGAKARADEMRAEIAQIDTALAKMAEYEAPFDNAILRNMQRERELLARNVADADYFLLRSNDDFEQVVGQMREKIDSAWEGWFGLEKPNLYVGNDSVIDYGGYDLLDASAADPMRGAGSNFMPAMTQQERDTYLYLLGAQGEEAAKAYYDHMANDSYGAVHTRMAENSEQFGDELAAEHPYVSNALSVIMSPLQLAGSLYAAGQALHGEEINPYHGSFSASRMIQTVRGRTRENITAALGEDTWSAFFAGLGYDALTSGADSAMSAGLGLGSAAAAVAIMSSGAAGSSIQDAKMRGATDEQALMMGGISLFAESVTEAIPMDKLIHFKGDASIFKHIVEEAASEAVGEGMSELFTSQHDSYIMEELSGYETAVAQYMQEEGMSEERARKLAMNDAIKDVLYSGAVGLVSGGTTQALNAAIRYQPPRRPQDAQQQIVEETVVEETTDVPAPSQPSEIVEPAISEAEKRMVGKQVTALEQALTTTDESSRSATVAGVLLAVQDDMNASGAASAAAQQMIARYGSDHAVRMIRDTLLTAAEMGASNEQARAAITEAAIGGGNAAAILDRIAQEGATTQNVGALMQAFAEDMSNPGVQSTIEKAVLDMQIASRVKELVADGGLSGLRSYEASLQQARTNLTAARESFSTAQREYATAGENMQTVHTQWSADPGNAALQGAMQQAIKDVEGKAIVAEQYRQSVAKYEGKLEEAEKALDANREDTMKRLREQALEDVLSAREQEQIARREKAEQAARQNATSGSSGVVYTGDNAPVGFHYAVVDARGLIASNDASMNPNPAYPQELQPRDRTRSASVNQITDMAQTLNPVRLGESADVQTGAPIVGGDFIVESGNGRVLAITSAMEQGLDTAKGYTAWLRENAATFGIDPASITDSSILVRVRDTDVDRAAFVKQANESTTASYSQSETAKSDAQKLTSDILRRFVPSESGEIGTRENGDFLTAFMQQVIPETEQASYRQADGSISQTGFARIRNALFQKAYGDNRLTAAVSESTDEGVKNMLKALTNVAPRIAVITEQIKAGTLHNLDVAKDLTAAAVAYRQMRRSGQTLDDYLGQYRMPGFETESEVAQDFMRLIDKNKRSAKGLTQAIAGILDQIEGYGDPNQTSLFEQTIPALDELMRGALEGKQDGQTAMFDRVFADPIAQQMLNTRTIGADESIFATSLPDGQRVYSADGKKTDLNTAIALGIESAKKKNSGLNTPNRVFVINKSTGRPIQVTKPGLRHGLVGKADRVRLAARITMVTGDVLENAVPAAELTPRDGDARSYAMLSAVQDGETIYPVRLVIRETSEDMGEIVGVESLRGIGKQYLYATRALKGIKNGTVATKAEGYGTGPNTSHGSDISLAELWDAVKENFLDGLESGISKDRTSPSAPSAGTQNSGPVKSGDQIRRELAQALNLPSDPRYKKYLRQIRNETRGYTRRGRGVVHVRDASNVETVAHEYGHIFDQVFGLQAQAPVQGMVSRLLADPQRSAWIAQYPAAERPGEAIAEFARYYIMDRQQAVAFGGQDFTNLWERNLQSRGWLRPFQQAAQDLRLNRAATAGERAKAAIDLVDRREETPYSKGLRSLATKLADYTLPLLELTNARRNAQGEDFDASKDTRTLLLAKENMIASLTDSCLFGKMVDPQGDVVHDEHGREMGSFQDILQDVPMELEKDFNTLWACLHARSRQLATIDKAVFGQEVDVENAIANIESAHPELRSVIDRAVDWYTQFMRTWVVDTGMLDESAFRMLRDRYPYYIPTFRSGVGENRQSRVRANDTPGNAVRTARGGTTNLYNPVMGLVEYMQRYIANYKHVEVLRAFDDTMRTIPGLEGIAEPTQGDVEAQSHRAANNLARNAVYEAIQQIRDNGGDITQEAEDALLQAMEELPEQGWIVRDTASGNDVLNVPMPDGSISRWTVYNTDMLEAILAQPAARLPKIFGAIGACTRFLCSMSTGRSFSFAAQNYASDTQTAMMTGRGAGNWFTFIPQQIMSMGDYLANTIRDKRGLDTSENFTRFQLFGKMGSRYAFRNTKTQEETRRKLYKTKPSVAAKMKTIASAPIVALEAFSGFLEDSTRYNEFRNGRYDLDAYSGRLLAGKGAREVTTDFSKRGKMEELKYAKVIIPFFGAQIQGVYKTARLFSSENEGHRADIAGRIIMNGLLTNLVLAAVRNLTWDDEEKEAYDQLSAYETNKYWHFKLDEGKFIRVKRSQDALLQAADAIGYTMGNVLTGYEGDAWGDLVASSREIASSLVMSFDTMWDPLTDAANNQTWYGGVIEDYKMEGLPTASRYEVDTPKIYRYLSGLLNIAGVKYSPLDVEYIIGQYTGSMGIIGSGVLGLATEGDMSAEGILGVIQDRLADRFSVDPVYTNEITSTFYDEKTRFEEMLDEIKAGRTATYLRDTLTQKEANAAAAEAKGLTSKGGTIHTVYAQVKELWKEHDAILEHDTMTDAEREAAARDVRRQINELCLQGNTAMGDFWAKYGYGSEMQQHTRNFLAMVNEDKAVPQLPTAYDLMEQTFADDVDAPYMKKATAVWEATGKDSALPHPNEDFTVNGKKHTVEEGDWDNWTHQYKTAYQSYLAKNSRDWDALTDDERLEVLQKAHSAGHNAAKKWYMKDKGIK